MEKFKIGEYEIEPQITQSTARLVVRRVSDPHGAGLLYVQAAFDPERTNYHVHHPVEGTVGETWETWSKGLADAMQRIEATHNRHEEERLKKEAERKHQDLARHQSLAELRAFIDRNAYKSQLDQALTLQDPHKAFEPVGGDCV